ncbi:MAG: nucleotide exchange factor GrpE [Candidatus Thorarchaeota archaeon]
MFEENHDPQENRESFQENEEEMDEVSLDFDEDSPISEKTESERKKEEISEEEKDSYQELHDKYLRLQAEFDNYRKRMNTRFEEITQFASESILLKVLDVVDNMQRALESDFSADPESAKAGVAAIYKQIEKLLQNEQVRPIESLGKVFDPYYQNAISTVNDESLPDKTVIQEYQKGYMLRDKVLRPAMVSVNRHLAADDATNIEPNGETDEDIN